MQKKIFKELPISHKIAYLGTFTGVAFFIDMLFYKFTLFGQSISFTPFVIFYISCWFGVFGGAIIATLSDFLSTILFRSLATYNPFYSISALLLGIIPYLTMKLPIHCKAKIIIKISICFIILLISSILFENIIGLYFYYSVYYNGNREKLVAYYARLIPSIITNCIVMSVNFVSVLSVFYPLNKFSPFVIP